MREWKLLGSAFVVLAALAFGPRVVEADSAAGSYVANVGGQQIALQLRTDGTASLANETGTWSQQGRGLQLVGSDGSRAGAAYDGSTVKLTIDGIELVFHRQRAAAPQARRSEVPRSRSGAGVFKPAKVLKGKRYKVPGHNASFTLPKGWRAVAGSADGQEGIKLTTAKLPNTVMVVTAAILNGQQQRATVSQLLGEVAGEAFGESGARVISAASEFTVNGHRGGQMILEANVSGRVLRARVGGVRIDRFGVSFMAIYPADKEPQAGPAFETMLSTFKGKAPKENTRLKAKLAGCWEHYFSSGGSTGFGSSTTRFRFDRQGNYDYRHFTSVSVGGGGSSSDSKEEGTFAVFGSEVSTQSSEGKATSYDVSFQGGRLFIGDVKYLPCN